MTDGEGLTTSGWTPDGTAGLEARGPDARAGLEAGLRAALLLAGHFVAGPDTDQRAVPIHAEAPELAELFTALVADLLAALDDCGEGASDVVLDGVLRRDEGGYRAWGYAFTGPLAGCAAGEPPVVTDVAVREDVRNGVVISATLHRR